MKQVLLTLSLLLLTTGIQAQQHRHKFNPEEFDRQLEQFVTSEAHLTPTEATAFFREYKEMNRQMRHIFNKQKKLKAKKPATESACKKAIEDLDNNEIQMKQIQKRFHQRFVKLFGASKTFDILKAEQRFFRKSMRRAAKQN